MGLRGRGAKNTNLTILDPVVKQRPRPIPGMNRYARVIWKKTVNSHDPDYFKPGSLEQLRAYCEAASAHKKAILEIEKKGPVVTQKNGVIKRNPWCLERDSCSAIMTSLSTKLQLNPSSTKQAGEAPKPKSKRDGLIFRG